MTGSPPADLSGPLRLSAKHLSEVALAEFCPRCFWIKLRLENKLPFQIFPGIFSSIDAYTKRIVHGCFDRGGGSPPAWLATLGPLKGYKEPPHHSKFRWLDEESNILLTGTPDGVFMRGDGSFLIVDYKTAKFTGTQDELFPMYEAQLNVYAMIGETCGLKPVSGLALIYFEPVTDDGAAGRDENIRTDGFAMGFTTHVLPVTIEKPKIRRLLAQARTIQNLPHAPARRAGCKNCDVLGHVMKISGD